MSFAVISACWIAHRDTFARLRRVDRVLTGLTLVLLFVVSILPSTTRLLYRHDAAPGPSVQLYGLNLVALSLVQAALWSYAAFRPGLMLSEVPHGYRWARTISSLLVVPVFVAVIAVGEQRLTSSTGLLALAAAVISIRITRSRFARGHAPAA